MTNLREITICVFLLSIMSLLACAAKRSIDPPSGIMRGITFTEISENGKSYPIYSKGNIEKADMNSTIKVKIDPLNIALKGEEPTDESLIILQNQLDRLNDLLEVIADYIKLTNRLNVYWDEVHNAQGDIIPGKEKASLEFKKSIRAADDLGTSFYEKLESYFIATRNVSISDKTVLEDRFDAYLDSIGYQRMTHESTAQFLKDEIKSTRRKLDKARTAIIGDAKILKFRVQAKLYPHGETPIPFHVPGYDNIPAGDPNFIDRLSFRLDEKEKQKLSEVNELNTELATALNELNRESSKYKQEFKNLLNDFRDAGNSILQVLGPEKNIKDLLESARSLRSKLEDHISQSSENDSFKASLEELMAKIETLESKGDELQSIIDSLKSIPTVEGKDINAILIDMPQNKIDQFVKLKDSLAALINKNNATSLPALLDSIKKLVELLAVDQDLEEALRNEMKDFTESKLSELQNQIDRIGKNSNLFSSFVNLANKIKNNFLPSINLVNITEGENYIDVPLKEVQDTELHLFRTARREGDLIEFSVKILDENEKVVSEGSRFFKVTKFGLNANVSGNLVFIKRDINSADERKINFDASPAISYTYRFRSRQQSGFGRFWNILNPGFGMNLAALNFNDAGMEIGVGPIVSLFGDIISGGYGYNLQSGENNKYWILGIGIFELFQSLYNPSAQFASPTN